jgi:dienelactone hydrolase
MEEGERRRDTLGIPELMARAEAAVAELPAPLVYAGFSMGAAAAQYLTATRPGAKAALLMHGALPLAAMGLEEWPAGVAAQVHYGEEDSSVDREGIQAFADAVRRSGTSAEVHMYPRAGHLFSDDRFVEYEPAAAELMLQRVVDFLAAIE